MSAQGASSTGPRPAAVLDMGASAIRLVVAEVAPRQPVKILEEAIRSVPLGHDAFSTGVIRSETVDTAVSALEGFRKVLDAYGVVQLRAVATSGVREARNGEMFLDRIRARTGLAFEQINEAEESRLVYLAVKQRLASAPAFRGAWTLVMEVGGGSTDLTLLRRGRPNRSGVYAMGAIRMRQQLNLGRQPADLQTSLLKRYIANLIEEIRVDIPLDRVTHAIAIGGDIRFAAGQLTDDSGEPRMLTRESFLAFCDSLEGLDEVAIADRFRLSAAEAESLVPALLVYRALLVETGARRFVVSDASIRLGVLLDMAEPGGRLGAADFERQVLASADALGLKYRYDRAHGRHVATLSTKLFDALSSEHGLGGRERLLLQVAALLHDIGGFVSLRAHHRHTQYLLASSQIFGLTDNEMAMVSNIARYHRRSLPQKSHLPYVSLDAPDRLIVNKLASILRLANALDAEHVQKIKDVRMAQRGETWVLELEGAGDLTMERMVAVARADMFAETFGRQILIRQAGAGE